MTNHVLIVEDRASARLRGARDLAADGLSEQGAAAPASSGAGFELVLADVDVAAVSRRRPDGNLENPFAPEQVSEVGGPLP